MQETGDRTVAYTPAEVAERLGVSTRTVQRLVANGRLHAVQLGPRTTRITDRALNTFLGQGGNQ